MIRKIIIRFCDYQLYKEVGASPLIKFDKYYYLLHRLSFFLSNSFKFEVTHIFCHYSYFFHKTKI